MFNDEEKEIIQVPPSIVDELTKIASTYINSHYGKLNWAPRIPKEPIHIARWWLTLERPAREPQENCVKKSNKQGHESWHCPYIDYCKYTLNAFLRQTPKFQDLIIDSNLDKIYWRGGSEMMFMRIIDEAKKYRKDPTKGKLNGLQHLEYLKRLARGG